MRPLAELVPPHVLGFSAYTPSRPDAELMRQYGVSRLYRLNNNENALGPPPAAMAALAGFGPERAAVYPSGDSFGLRRALGEKFGKDPDRFLIGNGSCEVISSVIKAFCDKGDNIVTAEKTFAVYEWVAQFSGYAAKLIALDGYAFDPGAMLAAVDERTKIVFVCNPNNPTGTWWDKPAMEAFLEGIDGRCIVVLDEAYREFTDDPRFPDGLDLMERHPNVVVFRTFSKMYGLAGLRVGYVCASPEIIAFVRRTHIVYSVNAVAQEAAMAALEEDREHILATRDMVGRARNLLEATFAELGLESVSGIGNFIMARLPVSDTLVYRLLMLRGVMVRTMSSFRFPNWIRVTLSTPPVMEDFAAALRGVLTKLSTRPNPGS
jgi:histidinol-phosphate aminotransferase